MEGLLPKEVVWNRLKRGFEVPQASWLAALAATLSEWIDGLPPDVPLKPAALKAALAGGRCDAPWVWRCLSTVLWMGLTSVRA